MGRVFIRFFAVLLGAELATLVIALLLVDFGVHRWTESRATDLLALAPQIAQEFEAAELMEVRPKDSKSPGYAVWLDRLVKLERKHYPRGGCTFAIFRVRDGVRGPWLSLLVGETPPYEPADDAKEPDSPPTAPVALVLRGEPSYTGVPYGGFGYQYQLSAYAPIRDPQGRLVAVLALDYDVSSLPDLKDAVQTAFWWTLLPAILLSVPIASFLATRFVEPFEFLRQIRRVMPETKAVVPELVTVPSPERVLTPGALETGGVADPEAGILSAIARSAPMAVEGVTAPGVLEVPPDAGPWSTLTAREKEVLLYVGQGLRNREIAEELVVTEETVKRHLKNAYPKLGVRNRTAAALIAISRGALESEPRARPQ